VDQILARAVFLPRLSTTLLGLFALAALLLAGLGIYGVLSYAVSERTKEIGLRLALGASGNDTVRMVMKSSLVLVLGGGALGLIASLGLARSLAGVLYGIGPFDLPAFVAAAAVLTLAGLLASALPAFRTTRVDPMVALRES
jgi:putative ABC transport system permease protein